VADRPVIVLEFNELTPSLIERFMHDGDLPNFARLRSQSRVFTTLADERPPYLEPWIQWVTVHSGLPYSEHGVFHLDEGHKLAAKRTWEILADTGRRAWVCGSMNVRGGNGTSAVLPDPWCTTVDPTPAELNTYFRFVRQNVLEHTNDRVPLTRADYAKFLTFMAGHGLSLQTMRAITSQLLEERSADSRWKRVVLLDLLQFDVFRHYYRRMRPAFSTFFLNSTAHYQHAYWDSMAPEQFGAVRDADRAKFRDAIRFGYQRMDALIARFMDLASSSNAVLVLCTALSQQPSPDYDTSGGGTFFRPKNFADFGKAVGLPGPFTAQPVMSEQFHLEFNDAAQAEAAEALLKHLTLDGEPVMALRREGARLFAGCRIHRQVPQGAVIALRGRQLPFFDLFYRMDTSKTGVHHPDGILWIRLPDARHAVSAERVPLTAVAPTFLKLFDVQPPSQMRTAPLDLA